MIFMKEYFPTIGLEIHAELKTKTKMFCDSKNDPDEERSNVNVCPVCMGHPGTLPVIHTAEDAVGFAKELQLLLRYLGVAEANMEKGEMRVEANISVSPDKNKFGTKVEVKNLNSFRAVERAIKYEIDRHTEMLENG